MWESRTDWFSRDTWDTEEVAAFLDVQANTINVRLSRNSFPPPAEREGRRHRWYVGDIYRYAQEHRPQASLRMPRIFPRVPTPRPAQFVGTVEVALPGTDLTYVLFKWIPGDGGGGIVALAYPVGDGMGSTGPQRAIRLYNEVFTGPNELLALISPEERGDYPTVWVVDERAGEDIVGERKVDRAVNYKWHELSNLIRTDLPWWPRGLRRRAAMLAWTPHSAAQPVAPFLQDLEPAKLEALIEDDMPELGRGALRQAAARLRWGMINHRDMQQPLDCPGFVRAAFLSASMEEDCPPRWTSSQASAVLHHTVRHPSRANAVLDLLDPSPAIEDVFAVSPHVSGELGAAWLEHVEPIEGPPELGHYVAAAGADGRPIDYYARDTRYLDNWVAVGTDRTVYATVGRSVPATGCLVEVELIGPHSGAFFLDSSNAVWPVPHADSGSFNSGYPGTGPGDFARAVARLRIDAAADLTKIPDYDKSSRLWQAVSTTKPPMRLDASVFA